MSISTTTAYCKQSLITCNNPMGRIELKNLRRRPMSMVPNNKYRKVSIPSLTGAFLYCRFGRRAEPPGKLRLSDTKRHPLAICWRLRGRKKSRRTIAHRFYSRDKERSRSQLDNKAFGAIRIQKRLPLMEGW